MLLSGPVFDAGDLKSCVFSTFQVADLPSEAADIEKELAEANKKKGKKSFGGQGG